MAALDLGTGALLSRVRLPAGELFHAWPTVAQVPWARHGAGHTRSSTTRSPGLRPHTPKSAVGELMRIAGAASAQDSSATCGRGRPARHRPFDGLVRIGIDEITTSRRPSLL